MASQVEDILRQACEAIFQADESFARSIILRDQEVDAAEVEIEAEVIRLFALHQPLGIDLRRLFSILKVNSDLERIADCAVNIAERARHLEVQPLAQRSAELAQLCPVVRGIVRDALDAYSTDNEAAARRVIERDAAIDALYGQLVRSVVANSDVRLNMPGYLDLLFIAKGLERIADHATNIAEDIVYFSTGKIIRHRPAS